ncbi:hypothetical protein [Parasutterella excrementihominis]|uniref:hypothetical protein n=1 Tax=Parasutterella excrementihominis TaxID=487175 RepID=UPI003AEFB3CD
MNYELPADVLAYHRNKIFIDAAKASSDFIKEFRLFVGEDIATFQRHLDEVFIDVTTLEIKKRVGNPCPEALASAQRLVESYRPIHELFHDAEKAKTSAELRHRLEKAIQRVNSVTESLKRLSKYKKYLRRDVNIHEVMELFSKYSGKELEDQIILKYGTKGFRKHITARKKKMIKDIIKTVLVAAILQSQPVAEGVSFLLGLPKAENFPAFVEQIKKSVSEKIKQAQETEKQEAVPNRIDNDLGTPTVGLENQRENVKKTEKEGNSEVQADLLNL